MSFSISYTYKIIDKYTPKLREIQKQTQAFNKTLRHTTEASRIAGKNLQAMGAISGKSARSINRATNKMGGRMQGFGRRIDSVKGKLNKFGRSAGAIGTTVIGGLLFKKAITASFDYEQSIINLTKKFDELGGAKGAKRLKVFQGEMEKVGGVIGRSTTDMNEFAFAAGKMGISLKDMAEFGKLTGRVAVAFEMPFDETTDALAKIRDKMGLSGKGLAEVLDTVNAAGDGTTAKVKDILEVVGRLSGQFKALRMPKDIAVGFAAVANQLSKSPQLAASGMKIFMQRLTDPKAVGMDIVKAATKDLPGTIDKVLAKLRGMKRLTRNVAIQKIFGAEASTFVMSLVESQELLNKTLGLVTNKTITAGAVQREFNRQTKGGKFQADQMAAANHNLSVTLGSVLRPAVKDIIRGLTKLAKKFATFAEAHPSITKLGLALGAIATIAAPMAITIGALAGATLWLSKVSWIAAAGTWLLSAAMGGLSIALGFVNTMLIPLLTILAIAIAPFALMALGATMIAVGLAKMWDSSSLLMKPIQWLVDKFDQLTGLNVGKWLDGVARSTSNLADSALGSVGDFLGIGGDEQSINVKKQMSNQTNINGNIRVEADPGTKVKQGSLKSSSPGNLGMNLAGAI